MLTLSKMSKKSLIFETLIFKILNRMGNSILFTFASRAWKAYQEYKKYEGPYLQPLSSWVLHRGILSLVWGQPFEGVQQGTPAYSSLRCDILVLTMTMHGKECKLSCDPERGIGKDKCWLTYIYVNLSSPSFERNRSKTNKIFDKCYDFFYIYNALGA